MYMQQHAVALARRMAYMPLVVTAFATLAFVSLPAAADPPVGYYDTVDDSSAANLRATLHEVIDDHTRYPYTSTATDTWDILEQADEDPNNASNILDVYKNASYPKFGGGNEFYQREHTWPSSYGFPNDNSQNYPYSDCHHLMLCDGSYNATRGNKPYRTCSGACTELPTDVNNGAGGGTGVYPGNSNWTEGAFTSGTWETWIGRRGDVARAMFYMDVRYEGGTHGVTGASEPDLILTDGESLIDSSNTGSNESVAYMGMLTVLLQWHSEDPVDDDERARNDVVFGYQLNRNPFVDHPEWVACLYNDNCGAPQCVGDPDCDDGLFCNGAETCVGGSCQPGTDPCPGQDCDEVNDVCVPLTIAPWINEFHYDNDSTDTGEFVEIAGPAGINLSGWTVVGYNGNGGGVYDTVNLSGTIPDQDGCTGALAFAFVGMQNGSPDGLALVDDLGAVIEFISYEGVIVATDGPANGMTSVDIGVYEPSDTTVGYSLQLAGTGAQSSDFTWQSPAANTEGLPNNGQTFDGCGGCTSDPECDDGIFCNGAETCVTGTCQPGTAIDCSDGVACTDDSCNETTDSCDNVANDANCDDGLFCNGTETCDPVLDCQAGTDPCPGQLCDEVADACVDCLDNADCDDAYLCTTDTCSNGACSNDPIIPCCGNISCETGEDQCNCAADCGTPPASELNCTDGIDDDCDTYVDCDDADCDADPTCQSACDDDGICESGEDCNNCPNDCFSGSGASCGNGVCEAGDGEDCVSCPADCAGVQTGKPSGRFCCGDGDGENPVGCDAALCDSGGWVCTTVPAVASCCGDGFCEGGEDATNCLIDCAECTVNGDCDDADLCTTDTCNGGICSNDPIDCDDGDPCTSDSCDPGTGLCVNDPVSPCCGDLFCDTGENSCNCPTDCGTPPASEVPDSTCFDGTDNDCDGDTDCDDTDCFGIDPNCPDCLPRDAACTLDSECCSLWCHRGSCK
jgi:endonuclease I